MREHKYYECKCGEGTCQYCGGGLAYCVVCKGVEGSLTTECCGRRITAEEERLVYNEGTLDFKNGKWVNESNYKRASRLQQC